MTQGSALKFNVVIPARYASTRLPGKPLLDLGGKPMLVRTAEQVKKSGAGEIVIATDDERIVRACADANVDVMMTSSEHESGTDRMHEVVRERGWDDDTIVVNVQGDEPFIPPVCITQVAELLSAKSASIATLATPIESSVEFDDPNVVKVVCAADGTALYFSRAAIPLNRAATADSRVKALRHIGIYGYRVEALKAFSAAGVCELELDERLEQLRALWHGWPISVGIARVVPGPGVDTPSDLEKARSQVQ